MSSRDGRYTNVKRGRHHKHDSQLSHVLLLFKQIMNVFSLDAVRKKLIVCCTLFVQSTLELLLNSKTLKRSRVHTLHGCYMLLDYTEQALGHVYFLAPKPVFVNSVPSSTMECTDTYLLPALRLSCSGNGAQINSKQIQSISAMR